MVDSVNRRDFSDLASRVTINLDSPEVQSILASEDVRPEDLRGIGDGDHVISGQREFDELYARLKAVDAARPAPTDQLDRATRLFRALTAQPPAPSVENQGQGQGGRQVGVTGAQRREDTGPTNPPVAAPQDARQALVADGRHRIGSGRDAHDVDTFTRIPPEVDARVDQLRNLPPAPAARGQTAPISVDTYLSAIEAREAQALLNPNNSGRAPRGMNADAWALSRSLQLQGITSNDVKAYLATGQLPDLLDRDGNVLESGEARMQRLENQAIREGSWPAVNSFTFLIGMRRSAMAAERQAATEQLNAMPADAPERAELQAAIEQSSETDRQLGRGLQAIYSAATAARERTSASLVDSADRLDQQAAEARRNNHPEQAEQLERRAREARDRGARMAQAESTYRSSMRGTGWDASRTTLIAAQAQVGNGRATIAARERQNPTGDLGADPPPELTNDDGSHTANGVPGALRLLESSRNENPARANDHRQLGLESQAYGAIATYHAINLQRGNYGARPTGNVCQAPDPALTAHRAAYLDARITSRRDRATSRSLSRGSEALGLGRADGGPARRRAARHRR